MNGIVLQDKKTIIIAKNHLQRACKNRQNQSNFTANHPLVSS